MGRKSSAKAQPRPAGASGSTGSSGLSGSSAFKIAAVAGVAIAIVVAVYVIGSRPAPRAISAPATQAPPAVADAPESAKHGPHPQANLPPLPFDPEPPARSPEVVRASYKFAAEHAEVLAYVPCYCGCEHMGHRGNEDCFVTERDANGDVTKWEPHGMT